MQSRRSFSLPLLGLLLVSACGGTHDQLPGNRDDHRPWSGIPASATIHFAGTEPFWSGEVAGGQLIYRVPNRTKDERIAVTRFAGRGGLSFSGSLTAGSLTLAVTPRVCNDGMSDRRYPFDATLQIGTEVRQGCAWTDREPFSGPANP